MGREQNLESRDPVTEETLASHFSPLSVVLELHGHRVVVANNGKEARAALQKDAFDLILMELQMPEMDGLEAIAALRRFWRSRPR